MLKRTPGKWKWNFSRDPETYGKPGIFVEGEGGPLAVMLGDLVLMENAPEMYEMLWQVSDELDKALKQGVITEGIHEIIRRISALLNDINVERQDTATYKEARR